MKTKISTKQKSSNGIKRNVSRNKTVRGVGTDEFLKLLEELNFAPILERQVRKVKWLYLNNNKHTMVYCEKDVRAMISRLQKRIKELEQNQRSEIKFPLPTSVRDGY